MGKLRPARVKKLFFFNWSFFFFFFFSSVFYWMPTEQSNQLPKTLEIFLDCGLQSKESMFRCNTIILCGSTSPNTGRGHYFTLAQLKNLSLCEGDLVHPLTDYQSHSCVISKWRLEYRERAGGEQKTALKYTMKPIRLLHPHGDWCSIKKN